MTNLGYIVAEANKTPLNGFYMTRKIQIRPDHALPSRKGRMHEATAELLGRPTILCEVILQYE